MFQGHSRRASVGNTLVIGEVAKSSSTCGGCSVPSCPKMKTTGLMLQLSIKSGDGMRVHGTTTCGSMQRRGLFYRAWKALVF